MAKSQKVIKRYCFTEKEKQAIAQGKKILVPPKDYYKGNGLPMGSRITVNKTEGWVEWEEEAE